MMRCFVVDGSGPGAQRKDAAAESVGRVSCHMQCRVS